MGHVNLMFPWYFLNIKDEKNLVDLLELHQQAISLADRFLEVCACVCVCGRGGGGGEGGNS